jgi:hypothetical protein
MMAVLVGAVMFAALGAQSRADGVEIDKVAEKARKSLVVVEYTYRSENVSHEEVGQGIVLNKDGVILIAGSMIPESLPRDYIKDIKIRSAGDKFKAPTRQTSRAHSRPPLRLRQIR